ncbi:alkaline phosphatase family protein [Spirosoma endophyticum]|uniref:Type I phosphodiesterase / nucleotide pyrophosphatase n=1 Tax=Spirosoma endophyticum TaxID=662367 RepID=A0A1I1UX58_9BACT|nr:alkaline phosphatase family protein [Spirosoma endophyticum]SFD72610.1 Type I phosphodiesterase / nucleotide pyrophosphatase [Spirosoma endophyticum]
MRRILFLLSFFISVSALAQPAQNLILVTLDGVRWQEVFNGADSTLLFDPVYSRDTASARKQFWAATPAERRVRIMPFLWNTIGKQGQLYGNRQLGNRMNVSNPHWFSYPGYNEILSGYADDRIKSNDKIDNPNVTVLEFLNQQPDYKGKVAVFSSWDVIEAAVNEKRSGIPASSANEPSHPVTSADSLLSDLTTLYPREFGDGVRADFLTYFSARQYVKQKQPRILFLSFDETDDLAYAGRYHDHLRMVQSIDTYLADLWKMIQTMPQYAGKTAILVTTDHGRGHTPKARWKDHGTKTADSYQIWLAAMGPGVATSGEQSNGPVLFQNQLAATLARLLGFDFKSDHPVGKPIDSISSGNR